MAEKTEKMRLFGLTSFDRSAKVRWLLAELDLPFEDKRIESEELDSPEFLRLNPVGRVPILQIGDRVIFESGAILAYLADLHLDRGMAPAHGSPERGEYQQWMYFASATLDVFPIRAMIIEDIPAGEVQTAKLEALQSDVRSAVAAVDRALARGNFLVGNRFTTADIGVSYHLNFCRLWPEMEVEFKGFPRVIAYLDRMKALPSAKNADVFSYKE
jgi:glutathione S-transferase